MALSTPASFIRRVFDPHFGLQGRLVPRWIFLRALALIYFSAFFSLLFQIKGLIGPEGVLPAQQYLAGLAQSVHGIELYWLAPSLFWISASSNAVMIVTWIGLAASIVAFFNLWPRLCFFICWVCFLAFVTASGDFSMYQSDGMLLEAGFIALFFVTAGMLPGWGAATPPSRASLFLLQWEWFRIYFESGMVKLLSGDTEWRNLTAMDEYYQNGPLPTWIGWYAEHLPHWFHVATAAGTLIMELGIVLMLFFPRRVRIICFFIVTPWEIGVILTANYTFLNYLVLSLGFLLLDDRSISWLVPKRFQPSMEAESLEALPQKDEAISIFSTAGSDAEPEAAPEVLEEEFQSRRSLRNRLAGHWSAVRLAFTAVLLTWVAYDTTAEMIRLPIRSIPLPTTPIALLEPFRIANQYGLFAVMTRGRYEIEFQGSNDGENWIPYPFRYKPQALNEPPGIYAPYQPRFDWNLWFASLGDWRQSNIVPLTEERLLVNDKDVLNLFRGNPFHRAPPHFVRAVLWQYWFTSADEKRHTGNWWRRELLGVYAPELTLTSEGKFAVVQWPEELPEHD